MQVDWITTIAQIINFLILVYLLRRFLYGPIIKAIGRREKDIADRVAAAQRQTEVAEANFELYKQKMEEFAQEKDALLQAAKQAAVDARTKLLDELRAEIETLKQSWKTEVLREQQDFLTGAGNVINEQACLIARHALTDLAEVELEATVVQRFEQRLATLDNVDKAQLARSAEQADLIIETVFPLSPALEASLSHAVHQVIAPNAALQFSLQPDLICGIALKGDGFKVEWNFDHYMKNLEIDLARQLDFDSLQTRIT
jgi:F-type H+-transporting ATPase subunit b